MPNKELIFWKIIKHCLKLKLYNKTNQIIKNIIRSNLIIFERLICLCINNINILSIDKLYYLSLVDRYQ